MQSAAPVYSIADEQRTRAESAAWARFAATGDATEFFESWLALIAARTERVRAALLLTRQGGALSFGVAAVWPDPRRDLQYLAPVAERVLATREGLVSAPGGEQPPGADGAAHVGYPLDVSGELHGAVVLDIGPGPAAALQEALRQLHWGSAWLVDHFRQRQLEQRQADLARTRLVSEVLATAMQHGRLHPSAVAVANELAQRLQVDRVSVGFEQGGAVVPLALSNTATFDARSDLVRWIGDAMNEVLDLGVAVVHPVEAEQAVGALAHAETARQLGVEALLSVPIRHEAQTIGVLTLERNAGPPFSDDERALATTLGVMLGPVWSLQQANERGVLRRLSDGAAAGWREFAGPRHPGLKLIGGLLALFVAGIALYETEHRVSARTVVEGSTQLAAVAPFDGFIAAAPVRAGETVKKGQVLARLDDRDLVLERSRWAAESEQLRRKYQQAQAAGERAQMGVLAAQMNQADAQLALADERLSRASIIAPFDGVVVSGDLSQEIGSPVQTGKLLFEVAPLAGYRVMMEVDDRDIARLALGQPGELVLSGMPQTTMPLAVQRITPVASQRNGRNLFAVEATLQGAAPAGLRPGMEGIAKVAVGERSLLWIWTHGFVDWLRLTLWSWMP
jgi:RND family efflux transporter MFP subunit